LLLIASILAHLCVAALLPLTADEAYAVVVSRSHALSYYDHPPMAFALARLFADLFGSETAFVVRLASA
jgi:4-amino-4-deoxy-L-arabinose transferase-like glycosyltransferase